MFRRVKIILWSLSLTLFMNQGQCCNYALLESNSDTFNDRIWSKVSNPKDLIYKNLDFLDYNNDEEIDKYAQTEKFMSLYAQKTREIQNKDFLEFADTCKELYHEYEQADPLIQASVHMLLKRVTEKYVDLDKKYADLTIYFKEMRNQVEERNKSLHITSDQKPQKTSPERVNKNISVIKDSQERVETIESQ